MNEDEKIESRENLVLDTRSWWKRMFTSSDGEPLPYLGMHTYYNVSSGLGLIIMTLILWIGGFAILAIPTTPENRDGKWVSVVCAGALLLLAAFSDYHAIRRIRWEHKNGGIWRRSRQDFLTFGLVLLLPIVAILIAAALVYL